MKSAAKLIFIVGAPRSGTTMLERILSAHSLVQGGPEPHLITPLAHTGIWDKVEKAPYDHILAAEAQKLFVSQMSGGEQNYYDACRAYCDVLYSRFLEAKGTKIYCLDKTPAYALVLPFLSRVYPDASYIVLTRHPLAVFSSFANSFFDGDYQAAHDYNPVVERYVPALAAFLKEESTPKLHVRYEDLVKDPEQWFEKICNHIGIPYEAEAINYGDRQDKDQVKGLGDPIGVAKHSRPTTASVKKWAAELHGDPSKLALARKMITALNPDDLALCGYPTDMLWQALENIDESNFKAPKKSKLTRYRLQRKLIMFFRRLARKSAVFRNLLKKLRLAADVFLRDE
ncbi:MAG: sulfotransferase [Candidatus Hydrogenedens sp.]|jgi:hypothetical protein|nr:sulfotransferase [Candidatus Hydrogenedens sp.]